MLAWLALETKGIFSLGFFVWLAIGFPFCVDECAHYMLTKWHKIDYNQIFFFRFEFEVFSIYCIHFTWLHEHFPASVSLAAFDEHSYERMNDVGY